jgi:hypothetical protein
VWQPIGCHTLRAGIRVAVKVWVTKRRWISWPTKRFLPSPSSSKCLCEPQTCGLDGVISEVDPVVVLITYQSCVLILHELQRSSGAAETASKYRQLINGTIEMEAYYNVLHKSESHMNEYWYYINDFKSPVISFVVRFKSLFDIYIICEPHCSSALFDGSHSLITATSYMRHNPLTRNTVLCVCDSCSLITYLTESFY